MKLLEENDYVLYDQANDHVLQFESDGKVVIYNDINEAKEDCCGNETVMQAIKLPQHWQDIITKQINE
jgi:hypothetical protein